MTELEPFDWSVDADLKPLPGKVLVHSMEYGDTRTAGGLIISNDDGKERGIRPRFCSVYAVGEGIDYVKPGDRILVAHGRWTRGVKITPPNKEPLVIRMVDTKDIMLVEE